MTNSVQAQENAVPTDVGSAALSPEAMALRLEVTARLTQFSDDLHQLMAVGKVNMSVDCMYGIPKSVVTTLEQRMQSLNQEYNRLDVKWNTYYQAQQMDIANSEDLMTMVASIEELKQAVKDTLDSKTEAARKPHSVLSESLQMHILYRHDNVWRSDFRHLATYRTDLMAMALLVITCFVFRTSLKTVTGNQS